MIKKSKNKDIIIVILSIAIILIGIGFIYLSIKYNSIKNNNGKYEVVISKVVKGTTISSNNSLKSSSNIINNKKTANISFKFNDEKDSVSYKVIIKNMGTIPAKIDGILEQANYNNNQLLLKHNNIIGEVIEPDEETSVDIDITNPNKDILNKDILYQISILTSSAD